MKKQFVAVVMLMMHCLNAHDAYVMVDVLTNLKKTHGAAFWAKKYELNTLVRISDNPDVQHVDFSNNIGVDNNWLSDPVTSSISFLGSDFNLLFPKEFDGRNDQNINEWKEAKNNLESSNNDLQNASVLKKHYSASWEFLKDGLITPEIRTLMNSQLLQLSEIKLGQFGILLTKTVKEIFPALKPELPPSSPIFHVKGIVKVGDVTGRCCLSAKITYPSAITANTVKTQIQFECSYLTRGTLLGNCLTVNSVSAWEVLKGEVIKIV